VVGLLRKHSHLVIIIVPLKNKDMASPRKYLKFVYNFMKLLIAEQLKRLLFIINLS
jgi:hypothetical protein